MAVDAVAELRGDEWLTAVLADVGSRLTITASDSPGDAIPVPGKRRSPHLTNPRVLVAAAAILVTFIIVVGTPVRESVADWLGIGATSIQVVPGDHADTEDLPALDDDLRAVTPRAAGDELGAPLPTTARTRLGAPDRMVIPPEGGVVFAWAQGRTTLWVRPTEADDAVFQKSITTADRVVAVDNLGEEALLITGDHLLITPHRRLRARATLVWLADDLEYRLESDLDPAAMIEIAHAVS